MDPERLRVAADEDREDDEYAAVPVPEVGFRTPGGVVERSDELEQQVGQLRDQLRAMEREVYGARKIVRRRRIASGVMTGGVGATIGALVAMVIWLSGAADSAGVVLALVLPGWVFGALVGYRWDKGDFPDAPPARLR